MKLTSFVLALSFTALAGPAFAQGDSADPRTGTRVHVGGLTLKPGLTLTNLGVDNNVFNLADTDHPQRDFTLTMTPTADWSMRLGRSSVTGAIKEDLVFYQRFASERSVNTTGRVALGLPLGRLTMTLADTFANTRDRPGFEIDTRSRHAQMDYEASAEIRAFGKTFVAFNGRRSTVSFEQDAMFLGSNLAFQLNRRVTTAGVSARHDLTPVTSLTFDLERGTDRFESSPLRDSNSLRVSGGVAFKPRSLLSGSATFGYRSFEPLVHDVPAFQGMTARVDVSARVIAATKLTLHILRDLEYSYDVNQPYYLLTGANVSLAHALYGPLDVAGRFGVDRLVYRGRTGVQIPPPDRTDSVRAFGATIGYRVGSDTRIGFNIDQQQRISDAAHRQYGGVRYGTSVTYGF